MLGFRFFQKYPLLGLALCCALLVFATAQNVVQGAALEGYFGKVQVSFAVALQKFTQPGHRGSTACMVRAQVEGAIYNMKMECSAWKNVQVNGLFRVMNTARGPASVSIMKGQFYIELIFLILELGGIFYFLSRACDRLFTAPNLAEGLRRNFSDLR